MIPGLAMRRPYRDPAGGYRQSCKVCWQPQKLTFLVPDSTWSAVVPEAYRAYAVCLDCFDAFAAARGVAYAAHLSEICFVGDGDSFSLTVERTGARLGRRAAQNSPRAVVDV